MTKVLFSDPLACAYNNGYWSEFFTMSRGTRQGCCLSPTLFTLVVEILGAAICQNKGIKGIKLGDEEIKAGQYANDLWSALLAEENNLNAMLEELRRFGGFLRVVNQPRTNVQR